MSLPRVKPPSTSIGASSPMASAMVGSTSTGNTSPMPTAPPWFETTTPCAPRSKAVRASEGFMIPLTTTGTPAF